MQFHTRGFQGYAVRFSPYTDERLALASSTNYGLAGNGRLHILNRTAQGLLLDRCYDTNDAIFDCAWSEVNEHQLVTSSGDGAIVLWDTTLHKDPIRFWRAHVKEAMCVQWGLVNRGVFASGSWDTTVKLFDPERPHVLSTLSGHSGCVYDVAWAPAQEVLCSCSEDNTLKLWDLRTATPTTCVAYQREVLCVDWNKYNQQYIVSGGVDRLVKVWDIRAMRCVKEIAHHEMAIRRLQCSPHNANLLATASYDMSAAVLDMQSGTCIARHDDHTEFVFGIDHSLFSPLVATCAWDERAHVFPLA